MSGLRLEAWAIVPAGMDVARETDLVMLHDPVKQAWLLFQRPVRVHATHKPAEILPLLRQVQQDVEQHQLFAAGFLAYEAAPGLDPACVTRVEPKFPLAWFGLYEQPQPAPPPRPAAEPARTIPWALSIDAAAYQARIAGIKQQIQAGDTYQVNYTTRLGAPFADDPWELFARLVQAQGAHYAAFVNTREWSICCASPELFFRLDGDRIGCRPMKGTAPRGLWPEQDREQARRLHESEKNRAENVMIVDMARNDLGRVAQTGTVRVDHLFQVERYPTLWQMTSTVGAVTAADVPELFRALFPAASITGAPKIRTMEIIAAVEDSPRKIYTGAIGYLAPRRQAQFNVAIRTVLVDKQTGRAEYGVGGGIVWDSVAENEFEECRIKARILTSPWPEFSLLETMRWTPEEGYFLLEAHLRRLEDSADFFSRAIDIPGLRRRLAELEREFDRLPQRVRLVVPREGAASLEASPLAAAAQAWRVTLAAQPIDSQAPLLYHKTTRREIYQQALAAAPGYDDVLLWNERGELTESTLANLVVEREGRLITPPLECGLLAGVYRAFLLEQKRVQEEVIRVQDLRRCTKVLLANSVRGLWKITDLSPAGQIGERSPSP